MRSMDTKAFQNLQVKDAEKGTVSAVFATLGVVDSHGDVTRPGAFRNEDVLISAYGHGSWDGKAPVGKGSIKEVGSEAIFEGQFFMDTVAGAETFKTVKNTGGLQEWSYGFDILESAFGEVDGQPVQFLDSLKVYEVSPVLVGAGVDTRTLEVKSREKMKFEQHIRSVLTDVDALINRAASVVTLRAEQGRKLMGEDSAAAITELDASMKRLGELIEQIKSGDDQSDPDAEAKLAREIERFELDQASQLLEA